MDFPEDHEKLLDQIKKTDCFIREKKRIIDEAMSINQEIIIVLIFGNPGSGKSTLLSSLLGNDLTIQKNKGYRLIIEGPLISHDHVQFPQMQIAVSNDSKFIFIVNTIPELNEENILNSYIINELINDRTKQNLKIKIKVIIQLSGSELESNHALSLVSLFNKVEKYFKNETSLYNNLAFVISKTHPDYDEQDYISILMDEHDYDWINFFKSHPDQIFLLPRPSSKDFGKKYEFDCRSRLLSFLKANLMIDPCIGFSLNNDSMDQFHIFAIWYKSQIFRLIKEFFNEINAMSQKENDVSLIDEWIKLINQMTSIEFNDYIEFVNFIKDKTPSQVKSIDQLRELNKYDKFYLFLTKNVLPETGNMLLNGNSFNEFINKKFNDSLTLLNTIKEKFIESK